MKKYIIFMGVLLGAIMFIAFTHGCDSPNNETKSIAKKPLNISVFLETKKILAQWLVSLHI